ncbi:unnamed protein product, partial [Allacma fusca]
MALIHSPKKTAKDQDQPESDFMELQIETSNREGAAKRKIEEEFTVADKKKARNSIDITGNPGQPGQIETFASLLRDMENRQALRSEEMEDRMASISNTHLTCITKRLTDLEKTFTGRMEELEARIDDMEEESSSLKSQIRALQEENQELRKKVEIN